MDEAKYQAHLQVQIEIQERWLAKAQPSNRPQYRLAVERKQSLERELELSRERQRHVGTQTTPNRANVDASEGVGNAIGRNINVLRKECGWSFDDLSNKTGIDKKAILGHVKKGRIPRPKTLKEYADAFSKQLGRKITAPEFEK